MKRAYKAMSGLVLGWALAIPALAQEPGIAAHPSFYRPLTLAPADEGAGGGGGAPVPAGEKPANDSAELAKKLNNPIASLISVPIQNNWDFGIGPANAMRYTADIQPVIPVSISEDWNLIVRTILPVIYAESPVKGGKDHWGLGGTLQSFFFSPKEPVGGWILGAGPVFSWPTETDSVLGSGKWGAGPTAIALRQEHGFTYGALVNHVWSYAGWGDQDVNSTYMQPFVAYTTKKQTTFALNAETSYNWEQSQWTVPLNLMINQLVKIGSEHVQFQVGGRYYAEKPRGGPDWGLRFTVTFLFPK
jgi:hypothetical protein